MQPRLKKRREFVRVAHEGQYCPSSTLIVQYLSIDDESTPQETTEPTTMHVGFTASRRVGNAVKRNRAKRRLREAFEQVSKDIKLKNCHIVIIAKEAAVIAPFEHLLRDLKYALKKCVKEEKKEGL